ncbi:uncharacterized protein LOC132563490 [Ylistrum balloti]|uniref:uncharacterized protein LOC132563490 n=1 Tax=Ylistrum balloti TaxID=509963 RepID=UPI002905F3D5|nr:uncharacterized protein LOC132563490 [Ylistrum balloti]
MTKRRMSSYTLSSGIVRFEDMDGSGIHSWTTSTNRNDGNVTMETYLDINQSEMLERNYSNFPGENNWILSKPPKEPPVDYDMKEQRNSKSNDTKMSAIALLSGFAERTSMVGVAYIHTSVQPIAKLIWTVLLLGAVGAMIFHLVFLSEQYYSRPKQTKITIEFSNLPPPAISICNTNPIRQSQLSLASKQLKELITRTHPNKYKVQVEELITGLNENSKGGTGNDTEEGVGGNSTINIVSDSGGSDGARSVDGGITASSTGGRRGRNKDGEHETGESDGGTNTGGSGSGGTGNAMGSTNITTTGGSTGISERGTTESSTGSSSGDGTGISEGSSTESSTGSRRGRNSGGDIGGSGSTTDNSSTDGDSRENGVSGGGGTTGSGSKNGNRNGGSGQSANGKTAESFSRKRRFVEDLATLNLTDRDENPIDTGAGDDPLTALMTTFKQLYMKETSYYTLSPVGSRSDVKVYQIQCVGSRSDVNVYQIQCVGSRSDVNVYQIQCVGSRSDVKVYQIQCVGSRGDVKVYQIQCVGSRSDVKVYQIQCVGSRGIQMILFLDTPEYIHGITDGYGARVVIHEPDTIPYPAEDGFFVPAAFETSIGLKLVSMSRLVSPFGICTDEDIFFREHGVKYTFQTCLWMCKAREVMTSCGCLGPHAHDNLLRTNIDSDVRLCETRREKRCASKLAQRFRAKTLQCDCPQACKENKYTKFISTHQYPTNEYLYMLLQGVCEGDRLHCTEMKRQLSDPRLLSLNFLKLVVYYEDLNYEHIKETPEIEDAQFLSDVGGALGLWIGLSLLSVFEVLQLIVELVNLIIFKQPAERSRKNSCL